VLSVPARIVTPMTNTRKFRLTELSEAVAPARLRHRALIDAACAWQAEREKPADPDRFALICASADDAWSEEVTPTRWTRTGVNQFIRCDVLNWCSLQSRGWQSGIVGVMWDWLDFLHATGRLDPASDPVAELRKPLICYGGLDENGEELPKDAPQALPCECALPYRETAELLNELVLQSERSGHDPLDPLRRLVGRPTRTRSGWEALWLEDGSEDGAEPGIDWDEQWWADPGD
jgi:hypothetical protein